MSKQAFAEDTKTLSLGSLSLQSIKVTFNAFSFPCHLQNKNFINKNKNFF